MTAQDDKKLEAHASDEKAPRDIDELAVANKKQQQLRLFTELEEKADAIDKVMTENGPPELDLTSG